MMKLVKEFIQSQAENKDKLQDVKYMILDKDTLQVYATFDKESIPENYSDEYMSKGILKISFDRTLNCVVIVAMDVPENERINLDF